MIVMNIYKVVFDFIKKTGYALLLYCSTAVAVDDFAYVVNKDDNSVSIIDTISQSVISTLSVGASPTAITMTPDGKAAYVVNSFNGTGGNSVSIIDTSSQSISNTVFVMASPYAIAIPIHPLNPIHPPNPKTLIQAVQQYSPFHPLKGLVQ